MLKAKGKIKKKGVSQLAILSLSSPVPADKIVESFGEWKTQHLGLGT
jgi:hypothetical protein